MKRWIVGLLLLCMMSFSGCRQAENSEEKILPASKETFLYEGTSDNFVFAVDADGIVYHIRQEDGTGDSMECLQHLTAYSLEGTVLYEKTLTVGTGGTMKLYVNENMLYLWTLETAGNMVLYRVSLETWEPELCYEVKGCTDIETMVFLGEYLYIIGRYPNKAQDAPVLGENHEGYQYAGEVLFRLKKDTLNSYEKLPIEYPIRLFVTGENTLGIYYCHESKGYGFLEFDQTEITLTERGFKERSSLMQSMISCGNKGYLYGSRGHLYYGTMEGEEALLFSDNVDPWNIRYVDGFVFYFQSIGEERGIIRRFVGDVIGTNRTIQLLSAGMNINRPFGNGYVIKQRILEEDEFALKVLAQDSDFDLYFLESRDDTSYNLMKNGVFYPLNEVEGVKEYIDACFPNVRELAYNEDGDIWMLPIRMGVNTIHYHKEFCAAAGVDFSQMDYGDFLEFVLQTEKENPELGWYTFYLLQEDFFGQYFQCQESFDTEMFREYAKKIRRFYEELGGSMTGNPDLLQDTYYYGSSVSDDLTGLWVEERNYDLSPYGVVSVPLMQENICPQGTITFLAVNPESDNLKDTLEYISEYAKYLLQQKNSFMLEDTSTYGDAPIIREVYEIYRQAYIRFDMDAEIYQTLFWDYAEGKLELEDAIAEMERRRNIYLGE